MEGETPIVHFVKSDVTKSLCAKTHVHFVREVPGMYDFWFEDYTMQLSETLASATMFPLDIVPFYHYDPRRHQLNTERTPATVAKELLDEHAFFRFELDKKIRTVLENGLRYKGALRAMPDATLNSPDAVGRMLKKALRSNGHVYNDLFLHPDSRRGVLWGIKMYPRLGYAPDDFVRFPNMHDLFKTCAQYGVPLTAHCGPGGMSVPDYYLYERYDERIYKGTYDLKHSQRRFDGTVWGSNGQDTPARWRSVLSSSGCAKLKVCLAHFGSSDTWAEVGGVADAEKKLSSRQKAGATGSKKDKWQRYKEWVREIVELIGDYENVYTDLSYFVNDDPSWLFGLGYDRVEAAQDLAFLIKDEPALKNRIMMGSDWYMIEIEGDKGVGDYFRRMFLMLREVSRIVGFDAWHQFAVINPLRFLGLIDEKKAGADSYELAKDRLEEYLSRIAKQHEKLEDRKVLRLIVSKDGSAAVLEEALKRKRDSLAKLRPLVDGSKMLDRDGNLRILAD